VHDVPRELFHSFIDERAQLAAAIFRAFPETTRMNYANLGNEVSHVHEHLIPRHNGDHNAGASPWPMDKRPRLPDADYAAIAAKIRAALKP
jgi:diadenosine tetraphosphate (Ap4A) HIT family hydrolase